MKLAKPLITKFSLVHPVSKIMSPLMVPVLLFLAAAAATAEESVSTMPGCQRSCGGVDIPFPFGIGSGCFRMGFEVACTGTGVGEILVLPATNPMIEVRHLSASPPEARVLLPVAWRCFNSTGYVTGSYAGDVNFNPEGVYRISNTENELYVLGCNTYAYINGVRVYNSNSHYRYKYYTGCITVTIDKTDLRDGACAGLGCCRVDIPPGITDTRMTWSDWSHPNQEFCPCDYAFIVEKGSYNFSASDLTTRVPTSQSSTLSAYWTMPLRLDWAIRDNDSTTSISCAQAPNKPDHQYACRSSHSYCIDSTNGPGYFCKCTNGYVGNPYVVGGCTNINECLHPESYQCPSASKCIDTDGAFKCQCKFGRRGKECGPLVSATAVALLATFVAVILGCVAIALLQTRNNRKRFNKNGGKILDTLGITIYTKRQLKKITNGYSIRLGGGNFGDVYEGSIDGKTKVAVKCCKMTTVAHRWKLIPIRPRVAQQGLGEVESFINEIKFQFNARHKNMVQLLGCCLETEIPILVFEFISNGSLDDALHSARKPCVLSLLDRLDIAIGSAEAIAYMHSLDNQKHVHGDIKPSNILLDGSLNPKVSDFGSSKLLSVDTYYVKAVAGDKGYIDPLYIKTQHFTLECDVYSFGVVLVELITGKRAMYEDGGKKVLQLEFGRCFKEERSGKKMYDTRINFSGEDAQSQDNLQCLDRIGMLAVRCLNEDKTERPTMSDVAEELKQVKANSKLK